MPTSTLSRVVARPSLTLAVLLSLAACGQSSSGGGASTAGQAGTAAAGQARTAALPTHTGPLWDEPQFTPMLATLRQKLPGKRRALRFQMSNGSASLETQDPAKPENADAYEYQGGEVSGPAPVNLSMELDDGPLEDYLFDWDKVAVEKIPALVKEALARTNLEGGEVVQVKIERKAPGSHEISQRATAGKKARGGKGLLAPTDDVEISIALKGTRRLGWLSADGNGNVTGSGVN
jgi:hypothetical protein